jgi:ABC-type transport system substrate-binding protein
LRKVGWIVFGAALVFAACSGSTAPATAPPTSPGPSSTVVTTTTQPPTTSLIETITTTVDRIAEIEAILLDLVTRRTLAQVERNEDAYRSVFANQGFLQESMVVFEADLFEVLPPTIEVEVLEVFSDDSECIAVESRTRMQGRGNGEWAEGTTVMELLPSGGWGFSFIGTGWACDGPHPFSDS